MAEEKLLIPCLYLSDGQAVTSWDKSGIFASGDAPQLARRYGDCGADALLVFDLSDGDAQHERAIGVIRDICAAAEIPVIGAGNIRRMEDVKKLLYAGCAGAVLNLAKEGNLQILEEVSLKFGREKILVRLPEAEIYQKNSGEIERLACAIVTDESAGEELSACSQLPLILHSRQSDEAVVRDQMIKSAGISGDYVSQPERDLFAFKAACRKEGIPVKIYESAIPWEAFKRNSDGLIPVIVQDYRTDEVLMLAYMNEEAYRMTLETGKMTYWSRSRSELWVKGATSGHFQYVKSLSLDCDNDTILAKVDQIGAACHTGNRSCFFQELMKKEYDDTNPLRVFQDVYDVILDRRIHPREGSYTNYLFDKGIDKILKKIGEECTEIVIAAKNPDKEEIKYEISDFLYHVMVLMAVKDVTWEEITRELARR